MVVVVVILSILLALMIAFNGFLFRALDRMAHIILAQEKLDEELAFLNGDLEIPDKAIAQKFTNVNLVYSLVKNPTEEEDIGKIFDISLYLKNHTIGLTYLVPPHLFDEIAAEYKSGRTKDRIKHEIAEKLGSDIDELDLDFVVDKMIDQELPKIDDNSGTLTQPIIPHCTVYHLKDGRWLWRQEEENNGQYN